MASAEHHSQSSVKYFGGAWTDYYPIHNWFDETRDLVAPYWQGAPDFRHRALRHHDAGMAICDELFDYKIVNADGVQIEVLDIATQHMIEDFDRIPTFDDWWHERIRVEELTSDGERMTSLLITLNAERWMAGHAQTLKTTTKQNKKVGATQ
jgi:hypothetical protein